MNVMLGVGWAYALLGVILTGLAFIHQSRRVFAGAMTLLLCGGLILATPWVFATLPHQASPAPLLAVAQTVLMGVQVIIGVGAMVLMGLNLHLDSESEVVAEPTRSHDPQGDPGGPEQPAPAPDAPEEEPSGNIVFTPRVQR